MNVLRSTDKVAEHFGVAQSRARAILAEANVPPVSGRPADDVRAIARAGQAPGPT